MPTEIVSDVITQPVLRPLLGGESGAPLFDAGSVLELEGSTDDLLLENGTDKILLEPQ